MAICELCGNNASSLIKINVAGSTVNTCNNCKSMGKVLNYEKKENQKHSFYKRKKEITEYEVISNASSIVNSNIGKRGINIQQLARQLNIKESSLNKILSGKVSFDLSTARKLETFFEIKLTQEVEESNFNVEDIMNSDDEKTDSLADMLRKKMQEKK